MNPPFWFPFGSMGLLYLDMLAPHAPELEQEMQIPATIRNVSHPIAVADIPAMYAGVPIDPGPAIGPLTWLDAPTEPEPFPCRREGGKCSCSGLGPCEATLPKSWCPPDPVDLTRFKLVYLGSPYTKYPDGFHVAAVDVCKIAAEMLREGVRVYSPIAHTHPLALYGNLDPLNHEIWLPFDEAMMALAEAMVIAGMDGWDVSYGVKYEIDYFRAAGKPVYFRSTSGDVSVYSG